MFSKELERKQFILRALSDTHAIAIVLELVNARDAGIPRVSHRELSLLVHVFQHRCINWQASKQILIDQLHVVEMLVEEGKPFGPDSIFYQLNPQMDPFCATLIDLLLKGEQGMRGSLPSKPAPQEPAKPTTPPKKEKN